MAHPPNSGVVPTSESVVEWDECCKEFERQVDAVCPIGTIVRYQLTLRYFQIKS